MDLFSLASQRGIWNVCILREIHRKGISEAPLVQPSFQWRVTAKGGKPQASRKLSVSLPPSPPQYCVLYTENRAVSKTNVWRGKWTSGSAFKTKVNMMKSKKARSGSCLHLWQKKPTGFSKIILNDSFQFASAFPKLWDLLIYSQIYLLGFLKNALTDHHIEIKGIVSAGKRCISANGSGT